VLRPQRPIRRVETRQQFALPQATLLGAPTDDVFRKVAIVSEFDVSPDGTRSPGGRRELREEPIRRHHGIGVRGGDNAVRSSQRQKPGVRLLHPHPAGVPGPPARSFEQVEAKAGMLRGSLQRPRLGRVRASVQDEQDLVLFGGDPLLLGERG
jgi:hypothetical protein